MHTKQILQDIGTGKTEVIESPAPSVKAHHLLVGTRASVVSAGTERMLVEFGKANLIQKARQQPEKVRQVLDKVRTDGLMPTLEAVRDKLGKPLALGYSNAGVVVELGEGVRGFSPGDFVVSNGPHAEYVCVPANLCARIPRTLLEMYEDESEAFERAAFTVVGAIALQGVRLAEPSIGEVFAVSGLGLVGQLAVQILKANGCRVIGIDPKSERVELAERFGAKGIDLSRGDDPVAAAMESTAGHGVDGVLLTAATKSSEPVHQAAQMCRKRGRIVLVGVTGLELSRDDFYQKELTFQVSCSYGPGRYDLEYEEKGHDYPYGFVRWTARRNFEAVLQLMAEGKLDVGPLISERVPLGEAPSLYERLAKGETGIGTILTYPHAGEAFSRTVAIAQRPGAHKAADEPVVGVIGAGSFATRRILPLLKKYGARRKTIASRSGTDASVAGRKFGFEEATSDVDTIFEDGEINTVFVLTPHSSHAHFACRALNAGKHVFVEKPLAITSEQLNDVKTVYESLLQSGHPVPILHVGFNRRFAPLVQKMKELLDSEPAPKSLMVVVNAGQVDADHWIQDPDVGGGRIIGEACHFVDLLRFLAGSRITDVKSTALEQGGPREVPRDTVTITLRFEDGSAGTVHYWANGTKKYPKERLEVFGGGKILVLDNFRKLKGYGWRGFEAMRSWISQDKGHAAEIEAYLHRIRKGGNPLIPFEELVETTEACFRAVESS